MFNRSLPEEDEKLNDAIDELYSDMAGRDPDSDEYAQIVDQLTKLYALKETKIPTRVSPDTLAIVLGNLAGIVLIVGHERMNVVTSKALNFVLKLR